MVDRTRHIASDTTADRNAISRNAACGFNRGTQFGNGGLAHVNNARSTLYVGNGNDQGTHAGGVAVSDAGSLSP